MFVRKFYQTILCGGLLLMSLFFSVSADTETEQEIKLGFVYNFAKFVNWPSLTENTTIPLVICAAASPDLLAKMSVLTSKKINLHPIELVPLDDKHAQKCHVIFLSESEPKANKKSLLEAVAAFPILTVSDIPNFVEQGGMIGMKKSDNRLRFDINLFNVKKSGLTISSQLLELADEIIQ